MNYVPSYLPWQFYYLFLLMGGGLLLGGGLMSGYAAYLIVKGRKYQVVQTIIGGIVFIIIGVGILTVTLQHETLPPDQQAIFDNQGIQNLPGR